MGRGKGAEGRVEEDGGGVVLPAKEIGGVDDLGHEDVVVEEGVVAGCLGDCVDLEGHL